MKVKISKSQWETIGKQFGWKKEAQITGQELASGETNMVFQTEIKAIREDFLKGQDRLFRLRDNLRNSNTPAANKINKFCVDLHKAWEELKKGTEHMWPQKEKPQPNNPDVKTPTFPK